MARNIRPIGPQDGLAVLEMCRLMHAESPRYNAKPFNEYKAKALITMLIEKGGGFVINQGDELIGMVGGVVVEHFFSDELFSIDLVLYIKPEHRGGSIVARLTKAYEDWAFAQGAVEVGLAVSTGIEQERTVCIYERLGYNMASYTLIKKKD